MISPAETDCLVHSHSAPQPTLFARAAVLSCQAPSQIRIAWSALFAARTALTCQALGRASKEVHLVCEQGVCSLESRAQLSLFYHANAPPVPCQSYYPTLCKCCPCFMFQIRRCEKDNYRLDPVRLVHRSHGHPNGLHHASGHLER